MFSFVPLMQLLPKVCDLCDLNQHCDKATHFGAFRLPQALGYLRELPCEPSASSLLGRDNVYLPVTHVGGPRRGPTEAAPPRRVASQAGASEVYRYSYRTFNAFSWAPTFPFEFLIKIALCMQPFACHFRKMSFTVLTECH